MRIAVLSVIAFGLIAAAPSRDQALKIMHDRHEGMEMIGKANKVLPRTCRELAQPCRRPLVRRGHRQPLPQGVGLVPQGHRSRARQDRGQARNLAELARFHRQAP